MFAPSISGAVGSPRLLGETDDINFIYGSRVMRESTNERAKHHPAFVMCRLPIFKTLLCGI